MPNYAGLSAKNPDLIRKPLQMALFITEDQTSASLISALTDATTGALLALPTGGGYIDCGLFTDEGLRFTRAIEQEDVTSAGSNLPTRTDITSDTDTLQVDLQETSRISIALDSGAAKSGLTLTTGSKELKITKPTVASPRRYRALALGVDGPPEAEVYVAEFYPRLAVTDHADKAFAKGQELRYGVTFRAEVDAAVGSPKVTFYGGPGWQSRTVAMGWPAA